MRGTQCEIYNFIFPHKHSKRQGIATRSFTLSFVFNYSFNLIQSVSNLYLFLPIIVILTNSGSYSQDYKEKDIQSNKDDHPAELCSCEIPQVHIGRSAKGKHSGNDPSYTTNIE